MTILLTREPVLNKHRAITANRLVLHSDGRPLGEVAGELEALAEVWPRERTVFLSLGGRAPGPELARWQPPDNTLIEVPASALAAPDTQAWMAAQPETRFCLDGLPAADTIAPGLFRFVLVGADAAPKSLSLPGLALAKGLADAAAFDAALKAGFDGAAGWFFLNTQPVAKQLAPSHAQIVRLLNMVREDAEIKDIEAVLKQDVALSFKLLRYINSAGFGLQCEIHSFKHAVTILGYSKLHKWLSLLLVTASKDPAAPALMQASVARGRFMELAGQSFFGKADADNLFITGAFSLLGVLLGTPLATIVDQMSLPEPINDALVRGEGAYAPFLALACALENAGADALAAQAQELQLAAGAINRAQLQALSFADSLQFN